MDSNSVVGTESSPASATTTTATTQVIQQSSVFATWSPPDVHIVSSSSSSTFSLLSTSQVVNVLPNQTLSTAALDNQSYTDISSMGKGTVETLNSTSDAAVVHSLSIGVSAVDSTTNKATFLGDSTVAMATDNSATSPSSVRASYSSEIWNTATPFQSPDTSLHPSSTATGTTVAATATIPSVHETMSPSIDTSIRPSADLSSTVSSETSMYGTPSLLNEATSLPAGSWLATANTSSATENSTFLAISSSSLLEFSSISLATATVTPIPGNTRGGEGGLKTGYIVLIIISVIVFMAVVIFSVTVIVYRCKKKHRMAITPEECPGKDTPDNFLHNKNVMGVKYKSTENRSSKMNVVDPPNEVKLQNNSNNNAGWETTALGSQSSMTPVGEPEHEKAPAEYKSPHSDQIIVNKSYTLNEAEDKSMDVNSEPKLKKRTKKKSKKRGGRSLELPGMVPKTIDPDKRRALPPLKLSTREG